MIAGIFHEGSGLGDQLFRYITVRTLAEEKGYDFGMFGSMDFKGDSFLKIDKGFPFDKLPSNARLWNEKETKENGIDIRSYDPEINFVEDYTIIDGSFEDSKYWGHNLHQINNWLAVEPLEVPDDLCVIGFRGGEYYSDPNLGLPKEYFQDALKILATSGAPWIKTFQVHTDDPIRAKEFFYNSSRLGKLEIIENQPISHSKHTNMGFNWRSARYAKYAIIPNSAFFILPRLLKHLEDPTAVTIAPRYWARRNTKLWARPACFYKPFLYI